jgi:D-alanyl-D-alanine carboxypeptidase (penicillin-binding protein 5/6)
MKKTIKYSIFLLFFIFFLQFFNFSSIIVASAQNSKIDAESMITIERISGRVLYSKNEHKRLPMASTTKILTAIVAIENCNNLDEKHEIMPSACGIEGSSIYLKSGEHLSVRELLYGLMLRSGNDSAVAIAEIISGSVSNFVELMNLYVKKLNLNDTHIVTVNGLHDDEHYTSAYDLAKITAYALSNQLFSEIVSTKETKIDNEYSKHADHVRLLKNKNKLLSMIDGADGVKTGYTRKAGKCFVGSATRNGMQIICVVLNSKTMFEGAAEYIEKAFSEYSLAKLFSAGELCDAEIEGKKSQKIPIILKNDIYLPLKSEEISKINAKIVLNDGLKLPLSENDEIGHIEVRLENNLIFSEKIYTISIEEKEGLEDYIKKILKQF